MFKPQEMTKVAIAASKNLMKEVIKELHLSKCMHIKSHKNSELIPIGTPFSDASLISETLVRVRSLKSLIGIKKEYADGQRVSKYSSRMNLEEIREKSLSILQDVNFKLDEIKDMEARIDK